MIYKHWTKDETWQPSDGPLTILTSVPEGAPKLIRPTLRGRDAIPRKEFKTKVQAGSHRMTHQLHCWEDFIMDEQMLRSRWDDMTDQRLKELEGENWCIQKLETAACQDKELEGLLDKETLFHL